MEKTQTYSKMTGKESNWDERKQIHILADKYKGKMHEFLEERKGKNVSITRKIADEEEVKRLKFQSIFSGGYGEYYDFQVGTYTTLVVNGQVMMSDTPMEIRTNIEFLYQAHGNVLIGGLGLGVILKILENKKDIKSVTIIEKNKEVIELVGKQLKLPKNFKIVEGDIFQYNPEAGTKFDTIYFDIWVGICGDNWSEMKDLKKRYKKFANTLNPNWWIGSWRQEDCKQLNRPSRSYY